MKINVQRRPGVQPLIPFQVTEPEATTNLGPLYTRSQGQKILGPTLSIFALQIGPKIVINAGTLAPRVANWPPIFYGILFSALGPLQDHKVQHLLVLRVD
jgi:hypothetical protein